MVIWVLDYFDRSAFAAFEVDVLQRGESRPWDALSQAHNSLQRFSVLIWEVTIPHLDALSQYTFYGPWIESFQNCWWDPEFPQLSQMVQSLPGFLDLCLNVCCPVLRDVYTEVLEAAHPLHRGPTDHKRSVGPLLSLPEVHDQFFSFAHIQRESTERGECSWGWNLAMADRYIKQSKGRKHTQPYTECLECAWPLVRGKIRP